MVTVCKLGDITRPEGRLPNKTFRKFMRNHKNRGKFLITAIVKYVHRIIVILLFKADKIIGDLN